MAVKASGQTLHRAELEGKNTLPASAQVQRWASGGPGEEVMFGRVKCPECHKAIQEGKEDFRFSPDCLKTTT